MALIQQTLELIRERLNGYLQAADPAAEHWVLLSNLAGHEGRELDRTRNKVVMFLANIQHETTSRNYLRTAPVGGHSSVPAAPPVHVNLFVLLYANFSDQSYPQGLGMISRTIQFFQENPYFDHQNLPGMPPGVDKLAFEHLNLDEAGLSDLMGLAGVKYLPSVYYKVRILPFQSDGGLGQGPPR